MAASAPVSAYGLPGPLRALIEGFQERRARTTADKSLALRLKDAMTREQVTARGLSFYIEHGAVAVYGNVADGAEREAILGLIARQPGVTRIVDHLRLADA
ncbi:BON domain-containing protein [Rubricoccus marinus]|uniref:BON domain-containing protein n=1 Tax=Rubricoccus marinus TaxID=716817 RepID=UPI0015C67DD3|nr:BON domain-containing protein [Rubricoccus marinus]